jgi:superfamily II DNA/RNA helicase
MAVYRKLAASSAAAIQAALQRRLQRLIASPQGSPARDLLPDLFASEHFDARYAGEYEENAASETREVFFDGEEDALKDLLDQVNRLVEHDQKLAVFVEQLVTIIDSYQIGTKVLIFTEYLATQQYLRRALETRFGERCVELIHGGQAHDERRAAIARFEGEAQFLVSTEAGGEGINLHTRCHVMVNYDLPWNPMRLVQRIGRLYRYGQKERVIVFNVHAPETIDAKVVGIMYERLHQVVRDMAVLGGEFREGMEDDILGQMAELLDLDIEQLLENAQGADIARSQARIDEALLRAREAAEHQAEVLSHVARYDPTDVQGALAVDRRHVRAFVDQMLAHAGVEVLQRLHQDREWDLRIPEQLVHVSAGFRRRLRI